MKKQLFALFTILSINFSGYAQGVFQKVYQKNYTTSYGAQQTVDGGYVLSGFNQVSSTDFDYLVVKTNSNGDTLWTKTYGGIGDEESYAMQQTNDGGYIIAGIDSSSGLGNYNFYLVKTNSNGDTLWTKSYGGHDHDFAQAVQQTADGGYIVAGYTNSFGGNDDVYLLKTDANGNLTWSKTYGGIQGDYAFAVKQTADGGYILAGSTNSFGVSTNGAFSDVYLLKTNSSGAVTWSKTYGRSGDDWAYGVVQTSDGGYAITGFTNTDSTSTFSDLFLIKTNANGDTLFIKSFGGSSYDQGNAIIETSDNGLAIGGFTESFGAGNNDLFLIKTNAQGSIIFNQTYGDIANDWAYSITQAADSGFVLSGYTASFGVSNTSFYLVKTDKMGNTANCNQTSPTIVVTNGAAIVKNAATITNIPATITENNTHTIIGNSVSVINACPTMGFKDLKNNTMLNQFSIYPNPNNGNLTIRTNTLKENTQAFIYNQLGQLILSKPVNNEITNFNINASAGVYQLRILSESELIYQTKIIKE